MASTNFQTTTSWLLVHEGGYVDHPKDPGGATNKGVTQRTYDGYRRRLGLSQQSVRDISDDEVWDIYRAQYWDVVKGDQLPAGLDYAVYDFAVNSGPKRAVEFLQKLLHIQVDGIMGNVTLGAIASWNNVEGLIHDLCDKRLAWMKRLRTWNTFGRGWTRRVMGNVTGAQPGSDSGVIDRATKLFRGDSVAPPTSPLPGKAMDTDLRKSAKAKDAATNPDNLLKVGGGALPGMISAGSMAPEGPMQWAIAAGIFVMIAVGSFILYKKVIAPRLE